MKTIKITKIKFLLLFLIFFAFLNDSAKANQELLQKTFGKPKGEQKIGEMDTKKCKTGARCIANKFINRDSSINNINSQKTIYKEILQEVKKYQTEGKNLPFAKGNDGTYTDVDTIFDDEDDYIRNKEIKYCNEPLRENNNEENAYNLDELLAPGKLQFAWPCIMSSWDHQGNTTKKENVTGLFGHRSYGAMVAGPCGTCCEEHFVTESGKEKGLKVIGTYKATFRSMAVPAMYRPEVCVPLKKLGCSTWTINADKIEYYFPTKKITLSKQPLYTRFIESKGNNNDISIEELFNKYKEAIQNEMNTSDMTSKTAKTHLDSKTKSEALNENSNNKISLKKEGQTTNKPLQQNGNKPLQPNKSPDATFLGQIDRGYGRFFKLEDIETDWEKAKGPEGTLTLPHVSAKKKYFGTDFENEEDEFFKEEKDDKENLAFFIDPGKEYESDDLKEKHQKHIDNPWTSLQHDTIGGASILYRKYYNGNGAKAFKEVLPKGKEAGNLSTSEANDYRKNAISYSIGNVSNLMSLTPQGSSDYILQTLIRTHNMFLEELKPIRDEQQGDASLLLNTNSITIPGAFFSKTTLGPKKERQSFKTKWDMFHCPIGEYDNGEKQPKLFNEFLNKAVGEIMTLTGGGTGNTEGKSCFKYENLLRNNLDLDQVNGILSKYNNVKTVANKGEISFTAYTLFSGTVGFPGQGYPFWKYGIGSSFGLPLSTNYQRKSDSKADPKILRQQFRLF